LEETGNEPGVIAWQERDAVAGAVGYLPVEHATPEARQTTWVVRIEADSEKLTARS
jgi:hypothetical protein